METNDVFLLAAKVASAVLARCVDHAAVSLSSERTMLLPLLPTCHYQHPALSLTGYLPQAFYLHSGTQAGN